MRVLFLMLLFVPLFAMAEGEGGCDPHTVQNDPYFCGTPFSPSGGGGGGGSGPFGGGSYTALEAGRSICDYCTSEALAKDRARYQLRVNRNCDNAMTCNVVEGVVYEIIVDQLGSSGLCASHEYTVHLLVTSRNPFRATPAVISIKENTYCP